MSNLSITIKGHEISPEELEFIKKNNIHSVIIFLWNKKMVILLKPIIEKNYA